MHLVPSVPHDLCEEGTREAAVRKKKLEVKRLETARSKRRRSVVGPCMNFPGKGGSASQDRKVDSGFMGATKKNERARGMGA